ncbi:phage antirepressor KilAC domain-containing protein [Staphylococcus hominis]|uniref:phage antirepressor KilAC domain-containing protein n=1 Tax=Staphylococcus hominis TaxID=1290 RepID=UPI0021A45C8B|nr:phage antirepressor KilAC domain-containing protein [Staphylococcus hominis]MCT1482281.1 phage antirepressor KilAC domain-containing protein [Staphylococcus hominis]
MLNDYKELIDIRQNDNGNIAIRARDLYKALQIKTRFSLWVERNFRMFTKDKDFTSVVATTLVNNGAQRRLQDYALTLDMAKHLALMSGTKVGAQVREYFIEVEKEYKNQVATNQASYMINDPIERAKMWIKEEEERQRLTQQNEAQLQLIEQQKPKVLFADTMAGSKSSILIQELAKLISQSGYKIGPYKLFEWLRDNGYLIKRKGESYNLPTQKSIDLGILDIKKGARQNADGQVTATRTTKVTAKGQEYFINKFNKIAGSQLTLQEVL